RSWLSSWSRRSISVANSDSYSACSGAPMAAGSCPSSILISSRTKLSCFNSIALACAGRGWARSLSASSTVSPAKRPSSTRRLEITEISSVVRASSSSATGKPATPFSLNSRSSRKRFRAAFPSGARSWGQACIQRSKSTRVEITGFPSAERRCGTWGGKVGEEGVETALAAVAGSEGELLDEAADLAYHLLVLLRARGLGLRDLERVLAGRRH